MQFVERPNLPTARVRLCAMADGGGYIEEIRRGVEALGIQVISVGAHPALPEPIGCHGDLQLHHLGGGKVVVAKGREDLSLRLREHGFGVVETACKLTGQYPGDIPLCCFALDGCLYGKLSHTAPEILSHWPERQPLRQGYASCSTCIVCERGIITADGGIAQAAESRGIAVLHIRPGHIALPGYDHGFIGGCAGLVDRNLLAFAGDIFSHPDGERIAGFCASLGVGVTGLTAGDLLDIGGILPLKQERGNGNAGVHPGY